MDFAIKYLSDPVCPAFGPVRSRVCPFSYMLYILLQKDFYYSVFSGICQEIISKSGIFYKVYIRNLLLLLAALIFHRL